MGFDFIEIPALDPASIDTAFTRRELERAGIGCSFSLGLDADSDISSGDPEKAARGKRKLEAAIRVAHECGAKHVCGILCSAFQKNFVPTTPAGVAMSVEILAQVAETAAAGGIMPGLEGGQPLRVERAEHGLAGRRALRADRPAERVGASGYLLLNIEESDVMTAIRETGAHLGYFHTGDSHRGYLGSGSIDFAEVFRALVFSGYTGPITFESFSSRVVGQPLEGILAIWRNLWEDGRDLASHALMYTCAQLKSAQEALKQAERSRLP